MLSTAPDKMLSTTPDKMLSTTLDKMLSITSDEMLTMKTNTLKNYYLCAENNEKFARGESTFKMDLHEYSIYDYNQLVAERMGAIAMPTLRAAQVPPACRTRAIPSSFNWAEHGVVTPVKDQKSCGLY